jgi:ABC-2 type transport system permease protein
MLDTPDAPEKAQSPPLLLTKTPAGKKQKGNGFWRRFRRNPIILKELRNRMRNKRTALSLALYTGVLSTIGLISYSSVAPDYFNPNYSYFSQRTISTAGVTIYTTIIIAQLILLFFLVPAFTSGVLTGEKERQTYDILLLTLLRPVDIVIGKLLSSLAYLFLLIICSLPVASISLLLGGVDIDQILLGLTVCVATALFFGTLGVWWSGVTNTTGKAIRNTLLTLAVLTLGMPALAWFLVIGGGISASETVSFYFFLIIVSLNPVIAIFLTTSILTESSDTARTIFFFEVNNLFYPQPWLIFTVVALVMMALLFFLSVKAVKPLNPVEGKIGKAEKKARKQLKKEVANGNN